MHTPITKNGIPLKELPDLGYSLHACYHLYCLSVIKEACGLCWHQDLLDLDKLRKTYSAPRYQVSPVKQQLRCPE